jgi:hypothetical protein
MLEFKVNKDKKEAEINSHVQAVLEEISNNCKAGVSITEICLHKYIFFEVRKRVEAKLKELDVNFTRLVLSGNVYSHVFGDDRLSKIRIND